MAHEVKMSRGNIYADLGADDADEMLLKAQLALAISEILQSKKLTQQQAAKILGMTQPKLSNLLRGQFRGISEAKMLECLVKLGRDVEIVVGKNSVEHGSLKVSFS
ncbi:TPA: XRE family transcriptional regulator [Kluyvera ascorbata]|uniref:Transcriptional regulator n=1 Tax=Kluyvera genomosp. 3 TaxID=2774055 RepID=A0A248KKI7_9ENTR|nr:MULTISPECIES: helix-turn-helix transcriptional regulator [Kluyvera]ASG64350.1 transcriptional regulator [Kluyvera genomosp. 3]MDA8489840.1 helix-turn-helix domain-containing protein [Kluyvera sp. Awk 3]QIR29329.1 XRE family transcriptional regulator [Kluyvera genomosp. 3]UAK20979.1 helix-turn-helix domain-containing protein [Kluyvera sp. CRP]HDT6546935.1 XRE family transcriptional regulator [Kluyvera ascorbata]